MKKVALILGIVLSLIGFFQGLRYFFDYNTLTQYGKGYVWGSIFLLTTGLVLICFGEHKIAKFGDDILAVLNSI